MTCFSSADYACGARRRSAPGVSSPAPSRVPRDPAGKAVRELARCSRTALRHPAKPCCSPSLLPTLPWFCVLTLPLASSGLIALPLMPSHRDAETVDRRISARMTGALLPHKHVDQPDLLTQYSAIQPRIAKLKFGFNFSLLAREFDGASPGSRLRPGERGAIECQT